MAEQRVPNLEEMDEQEAHRFLTDLYSRLSPEEEYNVRHQDYVMEMPQSGERFRGRENMRAFQEAYHPPRRRLCRCAECWSRRGCGLSRGSSTTATGGYSTSWSLASLKTGSCGEADGTSPSRSRLRNGGLSGSSGWTRRFRAHLIFREDPTPEGLSFREHA